MQSSCFRFESICCFTRDISTENLRHFAQEFMENSLRNPSTAHLWFQPTWNLPRLLRHLIDNFVRTQYSLNYDTSLPERKRGRSKGSIEVKPVTYGPPPRLGRPPGNGYKQRLKSLLDEDAGQGARDVPGNRFHFLFFVELVPLLSFY
ncbi:uncharacterized protein LACBIDRAFT_298419 [Laccaria bicolor S238N-H82]|uniref:Predicted protein n=1 Tax=Laccaria bicolor (strain S238N-H82 / ATCC MYA-4686) TaxID=486041 RepID=B0DCT5_LACBS|nr:uncharacterized protein LACBIDRAFT_298419 [Laccaria bicolor S238N-H82]EDR07348.1 predicted protein [Laccaria bicolor S238N-H82]|eukprot:XP_001881740.1 predicted protein [Laccaria bicolor S238N-H82]